MKCSTMELKEMLEFLKKKFGDGLVSVYVKGSYAMNEMREGSDIDLVVIFKETARVVFESLKGHEKYGLYSVSGLSLEELESGVKKGKGSSPGYFMYMVSEYKLLLGEDLAGKYFAKSAEDAFKDHKWYVEKMVVPGYEKGKNGFSELVKSCLWVEYNYTRKNGLKPYYSYKDIVDRSGKEIVLKAYSYWKEQPSEKEKDSFLQEFRDYLHSLKS